ncbi:hypothetical protein PHYPO_G00139750 [Pangasianodon hypophthalmus]|uniref:phospholipase A2 n=1 Tax=Pangasianodon hypophthalmus TaxID=310915 RepID=A0A5N5KDT2_PANHP|nr:hypothetical protein PHYPO_G00139750 [Pangasianodon hypophthalmus]
MATGVPDYFYTGILRRPLVIRLPETDVNSLPYLEKAVQLILFLSRDYLLTMRTGIRLQLAHLIVLSSRALISDTRNHEIFCFRTKSELGRTQCSFLRRPSAVASVLLYWTIWAAEHRVEECSISAEPALIQNYMSVCHERGIWDLHKTSSLRLNITLLLEPDSPCDFRPIAHGNFRWHKYLDTGYQVGSETRIRQKRAWILPGTLWCGRGSRAGDYEQLGMFERVDRCCREHDHCDSIIRPFTVNFGVFNPTLFTISHCDCDYRFKQCLLDINDTVSNMVGYTFFNILKLHCFELIQKRRCTKINWIGMCTSDKVAPYAILKHPTIYNATTSNAGIPEPPVCQGKPSATTKQKKIKLKQRKQSTSQKSYVPGASAAGHTFLLSEIIGQPYSKPKTISPTSTTGQPNCLMNFNTTLFHQKSKLINQRTPFSTAASTVHVHTTTSIAPTKQMATPSKKITPNKSKNITQWPITTVQTKLIKRYKPLTSKLNVGPHGGDHFQPKQQRGKDGKQDSASLHGTVSPNFITLSLASKLPRTNKFFESMSQTKKETNFPSRKKASNAVSSRSHQLNTSKLEMKQKTAEVSKLPKISNNTNSATYKSTAICDVTSHLDDCKYRIHPMEKLYGHHNTETTTIYHCDCIHRLTEHLKQLESIALLEKLLWKFVSMSCIEIPNTKECSNDTRCSTILYTATELESSLIKLEAAVNAGKNLASNNIASWRHTDTIIGLS